ncbi:hypothetical protein [Blastococcus sp. CCUG 61487]|uniref:hypothetical protein n=1 Tax=Blastococcus sp. CCUG 61487 TaxID=1840703 RepID=UPI0010BFC75E|nr:hypothetical protein [Blastococcus sp. CCUG 61487]TKJ16713.1 hypothetical protein A6V29_13360 [Blastococcus sp. CCUG 61487]
MDVPASAVGPWLALGAALGILLVLVVGAAVRRLRLPDRTGPGAGAASPAGGHDDLPGFLEHPPGTPGAPRGNGEGWTSLAPPAPAARAVRERAPAAASPGRVIAAFAVAAVLLIGVAAALAAARTPERVASSGPPASAPDAAEPARGTVSARLAFTGVVLEEHAVGITAGYPELELTADGHDATARLVLPTANCLAAEPPPAAEDARCRAGRTEYADLDAPELRVQREGDRWRVSGTFTTRLRPPGGATEPTGRSYEVVVTVAPDGEPGSGWVPADARLEWGDQHAAGREGASVVRQDGG